MKLYKLTDINGKTRNNTQWGENATVSLPHVVDPQLCSEHVIHAYVSPDVALLLNPIHADLDVATMQLWECEGDVVVSDWGKVGCFTLTTVRQIEFPEWWKNNKLDVIAKFSKRCAESAAANAANAANAARHAANAARHANAANAARHAVNAARHANAANAVNAAVNAANAAANAAAANAARHAVNAAVNAANAANAAANAAESAKYAAKYAAAYAEYAADAEFNILEIISEVLWDKYTDIRVISTALDKFIDAIGANR
jgi:pyruvate/2-oxoglutarate dehydrogenase complex dihydrolipoamide acyltransferase (E2) component